MKKTAKTKRQTLVCQKVAGNEQGLALLGYLKNVSQQLKPNNDLKVEDKN